MRASCHQLYIGFAEGMLAREAWANCWPWLPAFALTHRGTRDQAEREKRVGTQADGFTPALGFARGQFLGSFPDPHGADERLAEVSNRRDGR